jgi:hypothetical protein
MIQSFDYYRTGHDGNLQLKVLEFLDISDSFRYRRLNKFHSRFAVQTTSTEMLAERVQELFNHIDKLPKLETLIIRWKAWEGGESPLQLLKGPGSVKQLVFEPVKYQVWCQHQIPAPYVTSLLEAIPGLLGLTLQDLGSCDFNWTPYFAGGARLTEKAKTNLTQLTHLNLRNTPVDLPELESILRAAIHLKYVALAGLITNQTLALLQGRPLTHLNLHGVRGTELDYSILAQFHGLVEFKTPGTISEDTLIAIVQANRSLEVLLLHTTSETLRDPTFYAIASLPKLRYLCLHQSTFFYDAGFIAITQGCRSLRTLSLSKIKHLRIDTIRTLTQCTTLRELSVGDSPGDPFIDVITSMQALTSLTLNGRSNFSEEGLRKLKLLINLESLTLSVFGNVQITDPIFIDIINHCQKLHTLKLWCNTALTPASLNTLVQALQEKRTRLRYLHIPGYDPLQPQFKEIAAQFSQLEILD